MNIIIFGKGGREHALAHFLACDDRVEKVYIYPGNPGMNVSSKLIPLFQLSEDDFFDALSSFDLAFGIIGPEDYITNGFAGKLRIKKLKLICPSTVSAQLESSKIYSKKIMNKYEIKTAKSYTAFDLITAKKALDNFENEVVIKLSGLHAGKGVFVADSIEQAKNKLIEWKDFLSEGVLIEEKLNGFEVSMFYLCKDNQYKFIGEATDYKRAFDEDQGPNTGGMGCFSPNPNLTESDRLKIENDIVKKTLNGLSKENTPFQGVLFVGVMMTELGPYVLEYNTRFGDPETQTFLPRIKSGLLDLFLAFVNGEDFTKVNLKFEGCSVHVVKAANGYPVKPIINEEIILNKSIDPFFFFAGVKSVNGKLFTNGGRVCGLTCVDVAFQNAISKCYENLNQVSFREEHFRTDIGRVLL